MAWKSVTQYQSDYAIDADLPPGAALTSRLVLVVLDGVRVDAAAEMPQLQALAERGSSGVATTELPSLSGEAARWIAETRIVLFGMDMPTPSLDEPAETHHALLGAGIVVVEALNNLHLLPDEFQFVGFPLNFRGRDGSPIRAVAVLPDSE